LGNLGALAQDDVKRMLAYSGIAHAGTVLLVVAGSLGGDPERGGALGAALFYLGAYVFTAAGAFGLLALLERGGDRPTTIASLKGSRVAGPSSRRRCPCSCSRSPGSR
jgi:NADH-quinone oxidoreductase subunit N